MQELAADDIQSISSTASQCRLNSSCRSHIVAGMLLNKLWYTQENNSVSRPWRDPRTEHVEFEDRHALFYLAIVAWR